VAGADSVLVTGPAGGGLRATDPRFGPTSLRVTLDAPGYAEPQLRSVRVFASDTWACAVLTGALEVRDPPPAILGLSASAAAPGDAIEVVGGGFAAGATVRLGPLAAPALGGGDRLRFVVPPVPDGAYDLVVVNPDGQQAVVAAGLTVVGSAAPPPADDPAPGAGSGQADPGADAGAGAGSVLPPPGGGGSGGGCALGPGRSPGSPAAALLALGALLLALRLRRPRGPRPARGPARSARGARSGSRAAGGGAPPPGSAARS